MEQKLNQKRIEQLRNGDVGVIADDYDKLKEVIFAAHPKALYSPSRSKIGHPFFYNPVNKTWDNDFDLVNYKAIHPTAWFYESEPDIVDDLSRGLYNRYIVSKSNGEPVDEDAEYFVLRLDKNGSDPKHIAACRAAVLRYAYLIREHLPQLSIDLFGRYGAGIGEDKGPDVPPSPQLPTSNFGIRVENNNGKEIVKWFKEHGYDVGWYEGLMSEKGFYYIPNEKKVACKRTDLLMKNITVYALAEIQAMEAKTEKPELDEDDYSPGSFDVLNKEIDWTTVPVGTPFKCKIEGVECEGKVQKSGGGIFLCQNTNCGSECNDKLGFKYSYIILREPHQNSIKSGKVKNLELFTEPGDFLGYTCPIDMFAGDISKGTIINQKKKIGGCDVYVITDSITFNHTLPAEIVETWEKAYEKVPNEIEYNYERAEGMLRFIIRKNYVTLSGIPLPITELQNIIEKAKTL